MLNTGIEQLLKAQINDVMRTNQYDVLFNFTSTSSAGFTDIPEYGSYLITNATFPFGTFTTTEMLYNGIKRSCVNGVDYDPVPFTFISDAGGKMIRFLTEWSEKIKDVNGQYGYKEDYICLIEVSIMSNFGTEVARVRLYNAYPINIDPIALGYAQNDEMVQLQVSFKFDDIDYVIPKSLLGKIADNIF